MREVSPNHDVPCEAVSGESLGKQRACERESSTMRIHVDEEVGEEGVYLESSFADVVMDALAFCEVVGACTGTQEGGVSGEIWLHPGLIQCIQGGFLWQTLL